MNPAGKTRAVGAMFERIAPRYDLLNRLMSLDLDRAWRRRVVEAARPAQGALVLDAGAGTGDLPLVVAQEGSARRVIGIDLSAAMLARGRRKAAKAGLERCIDLLQADVTQLPFADGTFECITTAFMVRNLGDLSAALAELQRVLIGGGRLAILEITRPRPGFASALFTFYFRRIVPLLGGLISGDRAAYRYLPASVDRFLSAEDLAAALRRAGFRNVRFRRLGPGPVAIHTGIRPAPSGPAST